MKKILFAAAIICFVFLASCKNGCWSDEAIIQEAVDGYNKECPQVMDNGSSLTRVFTEGHDVVFQIDVYNESAGHTVADIDTIAYQISGMKSLVEESRSNDYMWSLCEALEDVGYDIIYRYVGKISGAVTEVRFSPAEILEAMDS